MENKQQQTDDAASRPAVWYPEEAAGAAPQNGGYAPADSVPQNGGYVPAGPVPQNGGYAPAGAAPQNGGYVPAGPVSQNGYVPAGAAPQNGGYAPAGAAPQNGGYVPAGTAPQNGGYVPAGSVPQNGGYVPAGAAPQNGGYAPQYMPAYQDPTWRQVKKFWTRPAKVLVAVLLVLLFVFIGMFAYFTAKDVHRGHIIFRPYSSEGSSESGEPSESEAPSSAASMSGVIPNGGESTSNTIKIQKKSGKTLTPEQVFSKVNPSVVGIIANVPTATSGNTAEGQGTGIIASSDGLILTNSHVLGGTDTAKVTVVLPSGKKYAARILGYDRTSDLAVVKISAAGLTPATFGSESELKVGEQVLAIGNPDGLNYSNSLTGGMVSALDRHIAGHSDSGMTYIQTDAAINPGNSGGPLCNLYGQVVGINSCKIVASGYEGMGFAIPLSKADGIVNQLIRNGYVAGRTRIGILCTEASDEQLDWCDLPAGLTIRSIDADSPLKNTGVQKGDVLYKMDGKELEDTDTLRDLLAKHKPGDAVAMQVYSVNQRKLLNVTIKLLADTGSTTKKTK